MVVSIPLPEAEAVGTEVCCGVYAGCCGAADVMAVATGAGVAGLEAGDVHPAIRTSEAMNSILR
jgi:hypothetical protein